MVRFMYVLQQLKIIVSYLERYMIYKQDSILRLT